MTYIADSCKPSSDLASAYRIASFLLFSGFGIDHLQQCGFALFDPDRA
jgi:hypothetical protein